MTFLDWLKFLFKPIKSKDLSLPDRPSRQQTDHNASDLVNTASYAETLEVTRALNIQRTIKDFKVYRNVEGTMDEALVQDDQVKDPFAFTTSTVPIPILNYYATKGFIGYQMCSLLNQHWLVSKACVLGARDAIRKGYNISVAKGFNAPEDAIDLIKELDKKFKIKKHLVNFARFNRIFGVRVAIFKIDGFSDLDYQKPFNIKGVKPGSYRGIVQVDPQWITPELDFDAAANPASPYFYEPTWWRVNGVRYHRTHLVVIRYAEVDTILKPTYFFGGVSLVQQIYQRIYTAERTADEIPQLALTKRLNVVYSDVAKVTANQQAFEQRLKIGAALRDNYGVMVLDKEDEKYEQTDTTLTDMDAVTMNLYQLVASIAKVPTTKLLGTTLKGFNATGEYEENNYHEELESIQSDEFEPLLQRHHQLLIASEIAPKYDNNLFETTITWMPLDSTTAKGKAENNKLKAEAGATLIASGAISPEDERRRVSEDPESGYHGIDVEDLPEQPDDEYEENEPENTQDPGE